MNFDNRRSLSYTLRCVVRFIFASKKLQQLYTEEAGAARYPAEVVDAFFDKMAVIQAAPDESTLRAIKSLHFEKLLGERGLRGERSIRLNRQYRLILRLETDEQGKLICIINIEDYH
jgi:proteic killer suppression protein